MKPDDYIAREKHLMNDVWGDNQYNRKTSKKCDQAWGRRPTKDGTKNALITRRRGRHRGKDELAEEVKELGYSTKIV